MLAPYFRLLFRKLPWNAFEHCVENFYRKSAIDVSAIWRLTVRLKSVRDSSIAELNSRNRSRLLPLVGTSSDRLPSANWLLDPSENWPCALTNGRGPSTTCQRERVARMGFDAKIVGGERFRQVQSVVAGALEPLLQV